MNQYNKNNSPDSDSTGEVISWVIVFILMFAFWPVGLLLLFRKLRGYSKPAASAAYRTSSQATGAARQGSAQTYGAARQGSVQTYGAARQQASQPAGSAAYRASAQNTGTASRQYASQSANSASHRSESQNTGNAANRQSAQSEGNAARQTAKQVSDTAREFGDAARKAAREFEIAARQAASQATNAARSAASQYSGYVKKTSDGEYSDYHYEIPQKKKKEPKKEKNANRLEKKSGKFVSTIMLLIAIALFIIGANTIARAAQDIWGNGLNSWRDLWMGAFYFAGAFIAFFSRNIGVRRYSRYKKYYAFVGGRGVVPIPDIARTSGQSVRIVTRDIQAMINDGYFGTEAYIDSELDSLVLFAEAAKEARNARYSGQEQPQPTDEAPANQYMTIILELRALNASIIDIAISDKIDRIEEVTAKIFRIVEDDPSKLPQIRRFMNYYLPTTLKLLRSYAMLEKQGVKGENITSAKENISRILDTLAMGYEQQLDQLFRADVIDIEADINVLENLMQQDGLTDDKTQLRADIEMPDPVGEEAPAVVDGEPLTLAGGEAQPETGGEPLALTGGEPQAETGGEPELKTLESAM